MFLMLRRKRYINKLLYSPTPPLASYQTSRGPQTFPGPEAQWPAQSLGTSCRFGSPICFSKLCGLQTLHGCHAWRGLLFTELLFLSQLSTQFLSFENISHLPGKTAPFVSCNLMTLLPLSSLWIRGLSPLLCSEDRIQVFHFCACL